MVKHECDKEDTIDEMSTLIKEMHGDLKVVKVFVSEDRTEVKKLVAFKWKVIGGLTLGVFLFGGVVSTLLFKAAKG